MKQKIVELLHYGYSYNEIVNILGCAKATISYHAKNIGLNKQKPLYDWNEIQSYYDKGNSYRECKSKFGFSAAAWDNAVKSNKIKPRSYKREISCLKKRHSVKKNIIKHNIIPYVCQLCGLGPEWNNKKLTLQIDHINGINNDHRIENLRFLCPNCHSQTDTYCHKNIRK